MSDEFIHPNWHVILIHYPLGLLSIGLLIELLSFLWRGSSVRTAGRWMLLIGAFSTVPVATAGIYAFRDSVGNIEQDRWTWSMVKQNSVYTAQEQWDFMRHHIWFNSSASVLVLTLAVAYIGASNEWRRKLYAPLLVLLVVAMGLMGVGAWHGGEAVYRYGTSVAKASASTEPPAMRSATDEAKQVHVDYFIPRMELHLLLAGLAVSLTGVGLALAIRATTQPFAPATSLAGSFETTSLSHPDTLAIEPRANSISASVGTLGQDDWASVRTTPRSVAARFWLIGSLVAAGTIVVGLWLAHDLNWERFVAVLRSNASRDQIHVILGLSILFLPLLLTTAVLWMTYNRLVLGILAALLFAAIGLQMWVGTTLLFDSHKGPIFKFNAPGAAAAEAPKRASPPVQPVTAPDATQP